MARIGSTLAEKGQSSTKAKRKGKRKLSTPRSQAKDVLEQLSLHSCEERIDYFKMAGTAIRQTPEEI